MTKTKLDICNMALAILGQDDLSSLQEDNQRAILCNQYYDVVREQLLRAHDWSWARAKDKLSLIRFDKTAGMPAYIYNKPAGCLFVIRVFNQCVHRSFINNQFKLEFDSELKNEVIRTGLEEAYAEYVRNIENTSLFDSQFVSAFAALLAHEIAMSLTGATNLAQLAMQKYQLALNDARYTNKVEQLEDAVIDNPFLASREW